MSYDYETLESREATEEEYYIALQQAINGGISWKMQGAAGRAMMDAINAGRCMLGKVAAFDYYGNRIPARTEVVNGTKGSPEFVIDRSGVDWFELMEAQ